MIAADTSSLIAFFAGEFEAKDVILIKDALEKESLCLPPIVLSEILSVPNLNLRIESCIKLLPCLEIFPDFWIRVGKTRATLIKNKLKGKMADSIIAQCCIDNKVPLITRDKDFRHFQKYFGLKLLY